MKFNIIIEPDKEGGFNVSVPALDGCYTQGETIEEAIENAKIISSEDEVEIFAGSKEYKDVVTYNPEHEKVTELEKIEFAKKMGATEAILNDEDGEKRLKTIAPFGFELVADATGSPRVMERELQFVEPDGTFLVFGVAPIGEMMKVEPYDIFRRDIRVIGSYAVKKTMQYSINLLASGKIQVKNLISSTYPLEDFEKGIQDFYYDPDHMKIQIIP